MVVAHQQEVADDHRVFPGLAFERLREPRDLGELIGRRLDEREIALFRQHQQQVLIRQKQELARALRAREDVLAIVSHDLRTPLSVIHTTASMLLNPKYQFTPQQVREQHERIRRNVELMNRMIGDLIDLANLRAGKLSIDLGP